MRTNTVSTILTPTSSVLLLGTRISFGPRYRNTSLRLTSTQEWLRLHLYVSIGMGYCLVAAFVYMCVLVASNELQQLSTYLDDSQPYFSPQYLANTSDCLQEAVGEGRGRGVSPPRWCRKGAVRYFEGALQSDPSVQNVLFSNVSFADVAKSPTCSYLLRSVAMSSGEGMFDNYGTFFDRVITVSIQQFNCSKQGWPARRGTSMRVELITNRTESIALPSCQLSHIVRSEYIYKCLLNTKQYQPLVSTSECNSLCDVELVVTLDYERYQAFHELDGLRYGMNAVIIRKSIPELSVPFVDKAVCCTARPGVQEGSKGTTVSADSATTASGGTAPSNSAAHLNRLPAHMQGQVAQVQSMLDEYAAVYFIGSSHMRYLWDAVAYNYFNASALLQGLAQHHSDEQAGNTWFIASHFSLEIPALLQQICDKDTVYAPTTSTTKKKIAVVLETSSWDLDYLPARNLVLFHNSSKAVAKAVKAFASHDHSCAGYRTAVVWMNSVPIPECEQNSQDPVPPMRNRKGRHLHTSKQSCFDKGHRNNYAIRAINEHFTQALGSHDPTDTTPNYRKPTGTLSAVTSAIYNTLFRSVPEYKAHPVEGLLRDHAFTSQVRLVDAYGLVYPHRNSNVCGLHYLCCKHAGKHAIEMQYSLGGLAVLSSVLATLQAGLVPG